MTIATGLATAPIAEPQLAGLAVAAAMEKAGLTIANSVLLFLTPEFARDPKPALLAASRASNCTRIIGCSAAGIFTDQDWVLDAPAAAAMVFGGDISLAPAPQPQTDDLILSLAAPNALNSAWISEPGDASAGYREMRPGRVHSRCGAAAGRRKAAAAKPGWPVQTVSSAFPRASVP